MKQLDRSKPHFAVLGNHHGACFEQNGALFDAAGTEVLPPEGDATPADELGGDAAELLNNEIGRLADVLSQKEGTIAELTADRDKALDLVAAREVELTEANKRLAVTDTRFEEEVSRADKLQAQVAELEIKLADAQFPDPPELPLVGGKDKGK